MAKNFSPIGTVAMVVSLLSGLWIAESAIAAKPVTLRVTTWDSGEGLAVIQEACKEFTKRNPNINVKVETWGNYQDKLLVSLGAGTAPDVFMLGEIDVPTFCYTGFIQPLSGFIKQDKMDISGLMPTLMKMYIARGELYGLPKDYAPFAVYYNKSLLEAAGIQYPKAGWTWNDAVLMAKKLTKFDGTGKITQTGLGFGVGYAETHVFSSSFDANFMANDKELFKGYLDSDATINSMQFMVDLKLKEHVIQNGGDFGTRKVAMSLQGPWSMSSYMKLKNFSYGIVPPPVGKRQGGCLYSAAWCMSTATKHKSESWKLVKFLGGPEGNKIMGKNLWAVPSWTQTIKEMGIEKDPNLSQLLLATQHAETIAPLEHPFYHKVLAKYVYPVLSGDMWNGKKTAAAALVPLVANCDKEYQRYMKTQPKIVRRTK